MKFLSQICCSITDLFNSVTARVEKLRLTSTSILQLCAIFSVVLLSACGGGGSDVQPIQVSTKSQFDEVAAPPPTQGLTESQFLLPSFSRVDLAWGAISVADFNNDGMYDLLGSLSTTAGPVSMTEAQLGLSDLRAPGRAYRDIRFADFNNDGFLDAIANVYSEDSSEGYIQLYWGNASGQFMIDENFLASGYLGLGETIVVADFDNDGYLDIFIPQYNTQVGLYSRNLLFKNKKNGFFDEVAIGSNIAFGISIYPEGAQAVDYDQDGLIDIYSAGSLFKNIGDFKFQDVTALVGLPGVFDEGAKFFDQNNDGRLDLIIHHPSGGPRIFVNNPNGMFSELINVFPDDFFGASYGLNVGDVNGDGDDDILIGGGLSIDGSRAAPRLWLYQDGRYVNHDFIESDIGWSDLVSFGDLDNNGSLDVILRYGENMILYNQLIPSKYVKIDMRDGGFKNQHGRVVNARFSNGKIKAMVVDGGSGYMSNQPYPLLLANNANELISFEVYCKDKVINFAAVEGVHQVDCGRGL